MMHTHVQYSPSVTDTNVSGEFLPLQAGGALNIVLKTSANPFRYPRRIPMSFSTFQNLALLHNSSDGIQNWGSHLFKVGWVIILKALQRSLLLVTRH